MRRHLCFVATLGMCFFALNTVAHAQQVKADTGGVAIGRDVIQSTIIIGIPQEKVDELVRDAKSSLEELTVQQRENIALLKEKLDLNLGQVRAALAILGENDIPPERLAAKLVEIAERFKDLQATASAQLGDDPKIAALKADAQKAIEVGELARADALLADAETEQRRALDRLAVNAAETSARRGEIALTRLRYREAAAHFANAATVFPPNSPYEGKRTSYLQKEANALYQQGYELGDNGALLSAIERRKRLLELIPREREPLQWARTQNNLGRALLASWRTRERDDEPRRGGRRLSRGAERTDARACAARVGQDAGQSGNYVCASRRTRERDGKARRGCRRLSRGAERTNARARAARVGRGPE